MFVRCNIGGNGNDEASGLSTVTLSAAKVMWEAVGGKERGTRDAGATVGEAGSAVEAAEGEALKSLTH